MHSGICIQDLYPPDYNHCHGCGGRNPEGLHIRSFPDGEAVVCRFTPAPHHIAIPGFVYGGLIACLIDCHSLAAAAWASRPAGGGAGELSRFVTASLQVDYLKPTPLGEELQLRAWAEEAGPRKVIVACEVQAKGIVTARGRVVAVRLKEG